MNIVQNHNSDPNQYHCPAIEKEPEDEETADKEAEQDPQISTLAIIGIVLGILLLLLAVGGLIYFFIRKRKAKNQVKPEKVPDEVVELGQHDGLSPLASEASSSSIQVAESGASINSASISDFKSLHKSTKHKKWWAKYKLAHQLSKTA